MMKWGQAGKRDASPFYGPVSPAFRFRRLLSDSAFNDSRCERKFLSLKTDATNCRITAAVVICPQE